VFELSVPGSKSMTQRALTIAALSRKPTQIVGALDCDDSRTLSTLLRALGATVEWNKERVAVTPATFEATPAAPVFCGNAGTTVRFGAALALRCDGPLTLDGVARMRQRPIGPVAAALEQLGASVHFGLAEGFPPLTICPAAQLGDELSIDVSQSSQFASGLLLVAPTLPRGLRLNLVGDLVSAPYLEMTLRMMEAAGAKVQRLEVDDVLRTIVVQPTGYDTALLEVEPDWSAAAFLLAAQRIVSTLDLEALSLDLEALSLDLEALSFDPAPAPFTVRGLTDPDDSLQGDAVVVAHLEQMFTPWPEIWGTLNVDLSDAPDLLPPLAAAALFAAGPVRFVGVAHARLKECDRIAVLATQLSRLGATVEELPDGLFIEPGGDWLSGPFDVLDPELDHRMAMAFGLVSLRAPHLRIRAPECVSKSFPQFWGLLAELRRQLELPSAGHRLGPILVGLRGTGKTTLGPLLAARLGFGFIDCDNELVRRSGHTISELIAAEGIGGFRAREVELLEELVGTEEIVLSTGGGAVLHPMFRAAVAERFCVWLTAPTEVLVARIATSDRPPLSREPWEKELEQQRALRDPHYAQVATMQVDTGSTGVGEAVERVAAEWEARK